MKRASAADEEQIAETLQKGVADLMLGKLQQAMTKKSIETGSGELETTATQGQNIQFGFNPSALLNKELSKDDQQHMSQTQLYHDNILPDIEKASGYAKSNRNSALRNQSS